MLLRIVARGRHAEDYHRRVVALFTPQLNDAALIIHAVLSGRQRLAVNDKREWHLDLKA